eukprot:gene5139-6399_t
MGEVHINSKSEDKIPIIKTPEEDADEVVEKPKILHKLSLFSVMAIGFLANVEYGIVMPSIWNYIQSLGGSNNDLGWALSGFSLAQLVALPLIGIWADKRTMRECFCASVIIGVIGNILYAMSVHPVMIVIGRVIAGIGSSNMAISNSYIASVTTKEQRTKYMGMINGINAIGLVAGPAFNLLLALINFQFYMGKLHIIVDPLRSPGWLLAFLLFVCFVLFLFFKEPEKQPKDDSTNGASETDPLLSGTSTPPSKTSDIDDEGAPNMYQGSINDEEDENNNNNNNKSTSIYIKQDKPSMTESQKNLLSAQSSLSHISSPSYHYSYNYASNKYQSKQSITHYASINRYTKNFGKPVKQEPTFFQNFKKVLDSSLLTCCVINFVQNFVFGALETMITPITEEQYGFNTLKNSIMYSIVSAEIIVFIFATIAASNKNIQDKFIIFFGQTFLGAGLALLFAFFGGPASREVQMWKFALSVAITTVGIPTQNTSVYSLYSKLLNRIFGDEAQGFYTGFMMLMGSGARILGPLWAGYGLEMTNRFPLFIVFLALWVFDIGVTLIFWKKLTFITDPNSKTTTFVSH